ncbi:MAG: hypothetical protein U5L05_08080 [Rubrivivax sp.]|nr:hypothetical protein [Rubrivivax sp.]
MIRVPGTATATATATADTDCRRLRYRSSAAPLAAALLLVACGETAKLPESSGFGSDSQLPEPVTTVLPTVNIAPARPWPEGTLPTPAAAHRKFKQPLEDPGETRVSPEWAADACLDSLELAPGRLPCPNSACPDGSPLAR